MRERRRAAGAALRSRSGLQRAGIAGDCQAAESFFTRKESHRPYQSVQGARCPRYVAGFADGCGVADYLAGKVGVQPTPSARPPTATCRYRLVRAVLAHLEKQPPNTGGYPQSGCRRALRPSPPALTCSPPGFQR